MQVAPPSGDLGVELGDTIHDGHGTALLLLCGVRSQSYAKVGALARGFIGRY
jgi:hypothetical protein